ncbi:hypothetical protein CP_0384 [Chlamydia pneumoniae AR39]|uniref:Uncharacterized protein n=1 Tax=Chlamydia pneumoniae TaxID=83558 RepID=Q9K289_CHLPN|nr:hypothetical protein CP_0384 [Chlamydia pneumoniae AR39]
MGTPSLCQTSGFVLRTQKQIRVPYESSSKAKSLSP